MVVFRSLAVALLVVAVGATQADAKRPLRPYKGEASGSVQSRSQDPITGLITIEGLAFGQFSHFGKCSVHSVITLNPANGTSTGTFTQRTASGAVVYGKFTAGPLGPGLFGGTFTFTSGTGRLKNISGNGTFVQTLTGPITSDLVYEGRISY